MCLKGREIRIFKIATSKKRRLTRIGLLRSALQELFLPILLLTSMISLRPEESVIRHSCLASRNKLTNHVHGIQNVLNSVAGTAEYISSSGFVINPVIKNLVRKNERFFVINPVTKNLVRKMIFFEHSSVSVSSVQVLTCFN